MEITGRLTADATVKSLQNDKEVVNFSIVINEYYRPRGGEPIQLTTYFNCAYWISTAVARMLTKGAIVTLSGRIGTSAYNDMNGQARASLSFHVNMIISFPQKAGRTIQPLP